MSTKIIISVLIGFTVGFYLPNWHYAIDPIVTISLLLMMFFVGLNFGQEKEFFSKIKKEGLSLLIYPILIGAGSLVGAFLVGLFLPIGLLETVTVGAAFGWYSLSGPLLSKMVSTELGTVAFLANLFREIITFFLIPLFAKTTLKRNGISPLAFASGGATTMDSTLPIILQTTDTQTTLAAFISGAILSMSVPLLLQFFIAFLI